MLLKHSSLYLLARGLPGGVNLLALALFTRLLSPEAYGQYALVVAGVGLVNAVVFQWLRLGLLRFLPAYQENREVFLSNIVVGFAGLVVLTGLFGIICLALISDPVLQKLVTLGVGLLWVQAFFELNLELVRSQLSPKRYGFLAFTKALIALGTGVTFAFLGFGAIGILFGLIVGMFLPVLWQLRRNWNGVRFRFVNRELFRQLLKYGLPLTATFALGFVVSSSDRFLLGWFLCVEDAGLYAVGYDLAKQSLGMIMMVVNLAAYPLAVGALERKGRNAANRQLSQNAILLLSVSLPSAAGFAYLAPNIAEVFLGQAFRNSAAELMPLVTLGTLLAGIKAYYLDLSFQLGRYTMGQVWVVLVAAILNIVLNLWWIPQFGLMGAAYATVAAYAIGLGLSWQLGRRVFPLPWPRMDAAKIVLATLGMVLTLMPLGSLHGMWALAGQIAWGTLTFGLLFWLFDVGGIRALVSGLFAHIRGYRL